MIKKIDPRHTTKGTIYLLGICITIFAVVFLYKVFFNTTPIEISIKQAANFDDSTNIIKPNVYKTQVIGSLSNFIIEKPTAYQNLIYDTEKLCAFNFLIFIVWLIPVLIIEIKLYNKGVFNVDLSKLIQTAGFIIVFAMILLLLQEHLIREFIFDNTKYDSYYPAQDNFFLGQSAGFIISFFGILSRTYKRAYELNKEQELTI